MEALPAKILHLLGKQPLKPSELAGKLQTNRQTLHKHLRLLVAEKKIVKQGMTPHVQYSITTMSAATRVASDYLYCRKQLLTPYLDAYAKHIDRYPKLHGTQKRTTSTMSDLSFLLDAAAVYSSNIEGNTLDLNSFLNSRMSPKKHRPKEAQEIEDLVSAYTFARTNDLNEKNVLQAHKLLSREFVALSRRGTYRKEPVGVFSQTGLVYMAVEPHHVANEMRALFTIIADLIRKKQTHAEKLFWGSWLHLMIALIHPFADGNGRTARLCEKWFLAATLGEKHFALPTEEQYWNHRSEYYAALKLGVNYWEADISKALPFFVLLPRALSK